MTKTLKQLEKDFFNPVHSCDSCDIDLTIPKDGDNYNDKFLCDDCHKYWGIK